MINHFHNFKTDISGIPLPKKFTFPFYYEPHVLCELASVEIQDYLATQTDFEHNFGLKPDKKGLSIGKMFGVLIVQNNQKEIGYVTAFSGKFSDNSLPKKFVPPIFNVHKRDGFFAKGEEELNKINQQISELEKNTNFIKITQQFQQKKTAIEQELHLEKEKLKIAKKVRKKRQQKQLEKPCEVDFVRFLNQLKQESFNQQFYVKELTVYRENQLVEIEKERNVFSSKILMLKKQRKALSNSLQVQIFEQYQFLNQQKETKSVLEIFKDSPTKTPPAGSGDCAAPRLLQYAFQQNLQPIAMAEFWWGTSPNMAIRKHQNFYPSCQGRCKPILAHMLHGIAMDENPLLQNVSENKEITFLYEDDDLVVINKPAELLSVPGKEIADSVFTRMKEKFPNATGALIVHRLDMSTSGILLISKTKKANKILQSQFINRTIKKRYVAVLDGIISEKSGRIELPLRVDLDDRPRQLVCDKHGKNAVTKWEAIDIKNGKTRVYFYPITGRTHQLRVHAAHSLGLKTPIIGDDLYGKKADRLHLHADFIEFTHPTTKKKMQFQIDADF